MKQISYYIIIFVVIVNYLIADASIGWTHFLDGHLLFVPYCN